MMEETAQIKEPKIIQTTSMEDKAIEILQKCFNEFHAGVPGGAEKKDKILLPDKAKELDEKKLTLLSIFSTKDLTKRIKEQFKPKIFNDAIHKTISLNEIEVAFIQTPEFFRLKNIKQLGASCHVYPGAVHTRFDHSLGVCHLAGEFVKTLRSNYEAAGGKEVIFSKQQEMCVRLAGLCHDLGHGPFSHLFEDIKRDILGNECLEHEELSILTFKWILIEHLDVLFTFVNVGLEAEHIDMIANMIVPDSTMQRGPSYLYDIVANKTSGLDVDKWDYFARDCHYLGLSNEFIYGRTMKLSRIIQCESGMHVGFMKKEAQNILGMFRTRGILHQKAYHHKVSKGIELMISDILMKIKEEPIFRVGSEKKSLKNILEQSVSCDIPDRDLRGYFCLTDNVLDIIDNETHDKKARDILEKIKQREIYWCEKDIPVESSDEQKTKKQELKDKYDDNPEYEIKDVKVSYSSEKRPKPVHDVYFYDDMDCPIPKRKAMNSDEVDELLTRMNIPKSYTDYRVRVFQRKAKHTAKEEIREICEKRSRLSE